jgi:NAD(P)-dependent dehydrogenase (short-subunit alcohol dehydrogenase family)
MLIENNVSLKNALANQIVLLTGGGGGIGFEAAKAFAYLGARVIIAELDAEKGMYAVKHINEFYHQDMAEFYEIDLADEVAVYHLCDHVLTKYGCPDIIFNNAAFIRIGAVEDVDIAFWDKSYFVNFKAPLLLAKRFLPAMKKCNKGTIVFVSSSGASPYMGAYEVYKTAQVELSNTLAMELENTDIHTYTIGPGLVKTETAMKAIEIVAKSMKIGVDEFYMMNSQHILDAESAGVGFALSTLNAKVYNGQEIGSIQVLMDYNMINVDHSTDDAAYKVINEVQKKAFEKILKTFKEQYDGWRAMNVFERQWVFRDLKKNMGQSAEQVLEKLKTIDDSIKKNDYLSIPSDKLFFEKLENYWKHQLKLLLGYQKDKSKLLEHSRIIQEWISDIEKFLS